MTSLRSSPQKLAFYPQRRNIQVLVWLSRVAESMWIKCGCETPPNRHTTWKMDAEVLRFTCNAPYFVVIGFRRIVVDVR
ncbi:hypothetical protein [Sulfurirhabdus autotrophica]|uniref:hypothetical protein n=1 Tax=Sulfurirhabdus autotrophica TaxID=1706046 RepID=UPI000F609347|nr:hypothetical protein [Sulfurirhabdus autotrophica]